ATTHGKIRSVSLRVNQWCVNIWFRLSVGVEQLAAMPSELESAMESLIMVFHRYAGKEGRSGTLTRRELRTLMENELSGFLKSQKDPTIIDRIMKDLDANGDGEVNFEEFVSLVVGLSIACEACYRMELNKTQTWNL
ncbi:hypothetical protein DNTS_002267, partial [Danionella cerebrum]